MAIVESRLEKV